MDKKYKELHAYLEKYTGGYRLTYHISTNVVRVLSKRYNLSRAEVMAGVIGFCSKTGIKIDFDMDRSNKLE